MNKNVLLSCAGGLLLALGGVVQAMPTLFDSSINVDGSLTPAGIDDSAFDFATGLGTITSTVSGAGDHTVLGFFDLEIDEAVNTFFNEGGNPVGTPAAGQSWEIDEPGFGSSSGYIGDIFDNFAASDAATGSLLDGRVFFDGFSGTTLFDFGGQLDDVSMATGWDFSLLADEIATITFSLTEAAPGGFYLEQFDPDSQESVFLSSTLDIQGGGGPGPMPLPEPGTLVLLITGLLGIGLQRRRSLGKVRNSV